MLIFLELSSLFSGLISILFYTEVLIRVLEKNELDIGQYVTSILLGVYPAIVFTFIKADIIIHILIWFYIFMIISAFFSKKFEDNVNKHD